MEEVQAQMTTMKAERIDVPSSFPSGAEIKAVSYRFGKASVSIGPVSGDGHSSITFENVLGLRILDEGDLLEFWPTCSSRSGVALFKILEGGWLAQESQRRGFLSADRNGLREYFVVGVDDCVNVLTFDPPVVTLTEGRNEQPDRLS